MIKTMENVKDATRTKPSNTFPSLEPKGAPGSSGKGAKGGRGTPTGGQLGIPLGRRSGTPEILGDPDTL